MFRSKKTWLGALVLVVLSLPVSAGAVLAQGPAGQMPANGVRDGGYGAGWRWAGNQGSLVSTVADMLGVSVTDIAAQIRQGKGLLYIAQEHGVSAEQIVDAVLASRAEQIQSAVEAGRISQEQADLMLKNMRQTITSRLESGTLAGPRALGGTAGRQGRFGGHMGTGFVDADGDGVCDLFGSRWNAVPAQ